MEKPVGLGPRVREPIKQMLDDGVVELGNGHGMQKWCVEAALLMFFDSPPSAQKVWIQKVRDADMHGGTRAIVQEIKQRRPPAGSGEIKGVSFIEKPTGNKTKKS